MFIFGGNKSKLISNLSSDKKSIILFSILNISFNESNLPFPSIESIKEINGLLKIIEKIVPW